jgi:hypothetical protein
MNFKSPFYRFFIIFFLTVSVSIAGSSPQSEWSLFDNNGTVDSMSVPSIEKIGVVKSWADAGQSLRIYGENFEQGAKCFLSPGGLAPVGDIEFPIYPRSVAIDGDYLYVAGSWGLITIDVRDPETPSITSTQGTSEHLYDVVISNKTLYLFAWVNEKTEIAAFSITDPGTPALLGFIEIPLIPQGLCIAGDYAYVVHSDVQQGTVLASGLSVIDIRDPSNMFIAGSYDSMPDNNNDIGITGDYAVITSGFGFKILDIENPAHIYQTGEFESRASDISISGDYAYIAGGSMGLEVVDIKNPSRPSGISSFHSAGWPKEVFVSGTYAYLAAGDAGVQVVDISDPARPSRAAVFDGKDFVQTLCVSGGYIYVPYSVKNEGRLTTGGIQIIDAGTPVKPYVSVYKPSEVDPYGRVYGVDTAGRYTYLACAGLGLFIVDISNPLLPVLYGSYDEVDVYDVSVIGNYAFLAADTAGLIVLDVTDPARPFAVARADTPGNAWGVEARGDYAYVADREKGLQIIDIRNPKEPVPAGKRSADVDAWGVFIYGDYAYLAGAESSFQMVDIRNPARPVLGKYVSTPWQVRDAQVSGVFLYLSSGFSGVQIIDISEPERPRIARHIDTPGEVLGLSVGDNYLYAADGGSGFQVIDKTPQPGKSEVLNAETMTAVIPENLKPGYYHVIIQNPGGEKEIYYNGLTIKR